MSVRSAFKPLLAVPFLAGALFVVGCNPEGKGHIDVLEPRYFNYRSESLGSQWSHLSLGRTSYQAVVSTGDRFNKNRGPNGKWNLDLWLSIPAFHFTRTMGDSEGFNCVRLAREHVRCTSLTSWRDINYGPHETIVDFKGDRIAGLLVRELSPPAIEYSSVEGTHREQEWPKIIARFRDHDFGWNDPSLP